MLIRQFDDSIIIKKIIIENNLIIVFRERVKTWTLMTLH